MKKILILTIVIIFACVMLVSCNSDIKYDDTMVVMSYNVRVRSIADDIKDLSLETRMPLIIDKINGFSPDIMGLQEVISSHMDYLINEYADIYDYVLEYRSDSSVSFPFYEATPIFYKKDKFELLDSGTFWLSETPDVMSKGWDSRHFRICTYVKLKVKHTGQIFYYYNTHLDFGTIGVPASLDLIIDRMVLDYPTVLVGDFNFIPTTAHYTKITEHMEDSRVIAEDTMIDAITSNSYSLEKEGKLIDYIFLSEGDFTASKYLVSNDDVEQYGKFASDHYAVVAYIKFKT